MVSIHFIHQVTRFPSSYPELGAGVMLYVAMILLVATVFTLRFIEPIKLIKQFKILYVSVTITF